MAGVAEHDREEEREGDDSEDGRVGLAISSHSICVNQFLKINITYKELFNTFESEFNFDVRFNAFQTSS